MNNTKHIIKKIISKILLINIKKIKKDTNLYKDLKIDSLDKIEIQMAIEEKFNIEISEIILDKLNTITKIINYINKKIIK